MMPQISEIETPALLVDLDILDRNLRRVADYAGRHGLRLRPHTKTHKSVMLAKRQLDLGAAGLTVAKGIGEPPGDRYAIAAFRPLATYPPRNALIHARRREARPKPESAVGR